MQNFLSVNFFLHYNGVVTAQLEGFMDQKTWLWRKRSSEKTIVTSGEEVQSYPSEKEVDLENSLRTLNEKLASVLEECLAKDKLVQNYENTAEDAVAAKQKAEEEVCCLKEELDEAKKQRVVANERLAHLNSALKDSMDQLNRVREEQDKRMHDAVMKTSNEFEKAHKKLEEKLTETSKKLANLTVESSYLRKALVVKENLIEDLNNSKCQTEAEFKALMTRLDSVEKENAFLRYEFRMLEKELNLRNEEVEYGRRSAEASHKQHLENVKKMKKFEAECQRLRALTRKRLPGPSVLSNIKSDVEVQGRNQIDFRRRNDVIHSGDSNNEPCTENAGKRLDFLIDQVRQLEKENKILKECIAKKDEGIFYHQKAKNSNEISSWDSAHECKMIGASDMSLMDDFVEMEKLAIVAVDTPFVGTFSASDVGKMLPDSSKDKAGNPMISMTKELVPLGQVEFSDMDHDLKAKAQTFRNLNDWLKDVTDTILKQRDFSKRSLDELLGDIKMALHDVTRPEQSKLLPISGYITWKSTTSSTGAFVEESSNEFLQPDINISTVRDEFKKHLGGDGPGTALELESVQNLMFEMEKIHSNFQLEIQGLKKELNFIKSSDKDLDAILQSARQNNEALKLELLQSQQSLASLQKEMEILTELKRNADDQVENHKLVNEDLDTQLSFTNAKLNEVLQKLSSVEVELDNKTHCCEELEGTCLELQLQLQSDGRSEDSENPEELLQTGLEITKASAKLAECEQTILKLGKQLKALGSAKEMSVVDKVLSITDSNHKKLKLRPSLRDQMLSEDNLRLEHLQSPKTKEIVSMAEADVPSVFRASSHSAFSFTDSQDPTPKSYLGLKHETKKSREGTLVIYPSKRKGGKLGFLRKLLLRKQKTGCKNTTLYLGK